MNLILVCFFINLGIFLLGAGVVWGVRRLWDRYEKRQALNLARGGWQWKP